MIANYTKGEWIKQGAFIFSSESPPRLIAEVMRSNMASPEQQANAHLIASAPDMYEALREIWVMTAPKCHDSYIKSINDLCGKALAKAEGRNA